MKALFALLAVVAASGFTAPARAEDCAVGYAASAEVCTLRTPANANADPRGGGWACNRGYYDAGGTCLRVAVPANASLSTYGHSWTCNQGFREVERACQPAETPQRVGLDASRVTCAPGSHLVDGACTPIAVPRHAKLGAGSSIWLCGPGYQEMGGKCVPIEIPRHARLGTDGDDWVCNRGYRPFHNRCVEIDVPHNASLGFYGDVWTCNRGYYEIRGVCLPDDKAHRAAMAAAAILRNEPSRDANVMQPLRRADHVPGSGRTFEVVGAVGVVLGGLVIFFFMRDPPVRRAATYKMAYVPRARGSGLALTWRAFGSRIDALTGAAIPVAASVVQCRNCHAWYQAESAATLRRENGAKCVACGRVALTQVAA
ncbi:MAG: hypothetical protein ACYCZX_09615 [Rhodospirillaceae bacterium]